MKKAIVALLITFALYSCKKPESSYDPPVSKRSLVSYTGDFRDFPVASDGMLEFRDDDHFFSYLDFLSTIINGSDSTDTTDVHVLLQEIEDLIGFTSARSIAHGNFVSQNAVGFSKSK